MNSSKPPKISAEDAEPALVARVQAGDRAAFDALVSPHRDVLVGLARRYVKSDADANDVVQRSLLKAFEAASGFRGEASFRCWLHRIVVHSALSHVRGRDRTELADMDDVATFTLALNTDKLVAAEVWQRVSRRISELPPKQRLVVELRLFHELSFKEIAPIADCSEDSAKQTYHVGVRKLREVAGDIG